MQIYVHLPRAPLVELTSQTTQQWLFAKNWHSLEFSPLPLIVYTFPCLKDLQMTELYRVIQNGLERAIPLEYRSLWWLHVWCQDGDPSFWRSIILSDMGKIPNNSHVDAKLVSRAMDLTFLALSITVTMVLSCFSSSPPLASYKFQVYCLNESNLHLSLSSLRSEPHATLVNWGN